MKTLRLLNRVFTNYFTFWIMGFSVLVYLYPGNFANLVYLITSALGVIMFGMGMTLSGGDFKGVLLRPQDVAIGFMAQYSIMPFTGFALAKILSLEPLLAAGVALAKAHFGALAALPSAMFSVWHNISGSALAWWWWCDRTSATNWHE